MATKTDRLHFTGNDEADALLAQDPVALLIGFVLDQQVPLQRAFAAPLELKRRFGTLEPEAIDRRGAFERADAIEPDPGPLEAAFLQHPARARIGDARPGVQRLEF